MQDNTVDEVRTLLAAAKLPVSAQEITTAANSYPETRSAVDALYAIPEARYVDPALRFQASAELVDWTE